MNSGYFSPMALCAVVSFLLVVDRAEARLATTCGGAIRAVDRASGRHLKTTEVFPDMMIGPTGSRTSAVLDIHGDVLRVQYRRCLPGKLDTREKWVPPENSPSEPMTAAWSLPGLEPIVTSQKGGRNVPALNSLHVLRSGADAKEIRATGLILEVNEKSGQMEIAGWRGSSAPNHVPPRWNGRVSWDQEWQPLFIDEGSFLIFDAATSLCRYDLRTGRREWCHTIDPLGDRRAGPNLMVDLYRLPEGYLVVTDGSGMFLLNPDNGLAYWHHPYANMDAVPAVLAMVDALILGPLQEW